MTTVEMCPECGFPDAECQHGICDWHGRPIHTWDCPMCKLDEEDIFLVLYECEHCPKTLPTLPGDDDTAAALSWAGSGAEEAMRDVHS